MIKVFTCAASPNQAGNELTSQFESWEYQISKKHKIEIIDFHTNSNGYGWMLTVHYKVIKNG